MRTAYISKRKQKMRIHKTEPLHNDTNVGTIKTMQANQNTIADLQLMQASIKSEQDGGKLNVWKFQRQLLLHVGHARHKWQAIHISSLMHLNRTIQRAVHLQTGM